MCSQLSTSVLIRFCSFPSRLQCIHVMANVHLPPYSTLTSTVMQGSVSAAVRVDYKHGPSHCTALGMPAWWTTTSRNLLTVPANGTKNTNKCVTNTKFFFMGCI